MVDVDDQHGDGGRETGDAHSSASLPQRAVPADGVVRLQQEHGGKSSHPDGQGRAPHQRGKVASMSMTVCPCAPVDMLVASG